MREGRKREEDRRIALAAMNWYINLFTDAIGTERERTLCKSISQL